MMMTSWWVGKDREAFNVALKEHTADIMRRGGRRPPAVEPPSPSAAVAVIETQVPLPVRAQPEPPATVIEPQPRRASTPHAAWKPGSRGRTPMWVARFLTAARELRTALKESDTAREHPELLPAAVVMVCGFFLGQREDWIVAWTGYAPADVRRIIRNLRQQHVWIAPRRIACDWLELFAPESRLTKARAFELNLALWLDAMVADGQLTRERKDGAFFYGLKR